jgi:hypothetical protein
MNEEQLAVWVFFRSAQSLPTVVKSWWNEDCHRSIQSNVSQFVEMQVSPETLRQELQRIKAAKTLGEMHVTGSAVSREITAVYEQDEVRKPSIYRCIRVVTKINYYKVSISFYMNDLLLIFVDETQCLDPCSYDIPFKEC